MGVVTRMLPSERRVKEIAADVEHVVERLFFFTLLTM